MLTPDIERQLDDLLQKVNVFNGAMEICPPPILPLDFILAKKYSNSFPQHAVNAIGIDGSQAKYMLSPTCCYPVFRSLEASRLSGDLLVTSKNNCFRNEKEFIPSVRQLAFKMREYIFLSSDFDRVSQWVADVKTQIPVSLKSLGVESSVEKATDPFFNPRDFQQAMQSAENLKSEFICNGISLGSINMHLKAFSKSCNIVNEAGELVYTACFGLGYDRVAYSIHQ